VGEDDPRWGEAWLLRHELASKQGRYDEMEQWLARAEQAADLPGWEAVRDRARLLRGVRDRVGGRYQRALTFLVDVEREAARRGDRALMAESRLAVGQTLLESGDVAGAELWSRLALQEYEATADGLGTAECWQLLGEVAKEAGDHAQASLLLRRAEALFEQLGHRWKTADALNSQGDVARAQGDLDLAATLYRRARGLLKAIGSKSWVFPEYNTGLLHLARGDHLRARGMLEVAMEVFTEQGNTSAMAHAHLALACCSAADERWLLWDDHLREAQGLLLHTGFSDEDTARMATQAAAEALEGGQPDRARDAYELALSLWQALDRAREQEEVQAALDRISAGLVEPTTEG
jgi:tetratricopeptide (TPR) repeat protein